MGMSFTWFDDLYPHYSTMDTTVQKFGKSSDAEAEEKTECHEMKIEFNSC